MDYYNDNFTYDLDTPNDKDITYHFEFDQSDHVLEGYLDYLQEYETTDATYDEEGNPTYTTRIVTVEEQVEEVGRAFMIYYKSTIWGR